MKRRISFASQGQKLSGVYDEPMNSNKHPVILLHGLTNSSIDCPLIVEARQTLLSSGFPIFTFDYYGSGKSPGMFAEKTFSLLYRNTIDALGYVVKVMGFREIGLWGRSLGGIMASTVCDDPHVFGSVIISSTTHTNNTFKSFFKKANAFSLPISGTGKIKGKPVLPYNFYKETVWIDELQKRHLSDARNVIVIQGTEDKTIGKMTYSKEIYDLVRRKKQIRYINGANHAYEGYEKETVKHGVMWLQSLI